MVQKILIFKFLFLILLLDSNILNAKNIEGYPKIIDGDTLHINNIKIRLHGIDAPEKNQKCNFNKKQWLCGKQSANELRKIINNKIVECISNKVDIYKRYIAVCFVNQININKTMVKKGWAIAYRYYSKDYIMDEKYARENKLGIWKGSFLEPYLYRKKK